MPLRFYRRLLDSYEPYLIARPGVLTDLDREPLGIPIRDEAVFDPQRVSASVFVNLVKRLDEMAYGPVGLSMPDWVFYDCGVMPGAVFGFARPATELPLWARRVLQVPDGYAGLCPVSLFICIPMVGRESTLVYTLCSVNQVAPGAAHQGLWRTTLAAGSKAFKLRTLVHAIQWRSPQLALFAGLGPLELMTAWTPAHDNPATCTFRVRTDDAARERLLRGDLVGAEGIHRYLDADDPQAMQELQAEIEDGLRVAVVGPEEIRGAETRVPLGLLDADGDLEAEDGAGFKRRFQG